MPWRWALTLLGPLQLAAVTVLDIDGGSHALPAEQEAKATIVYFVTHDCPISNRYAPEIQRICAEHASSGVRCMLAYVDSTITAEAIREHRSTYGLDQPAVHDTNHELVRLAGATVTPEAALFDQRGGLAYLGRIDNRYAALGTPRRQATERDLREALASVLSGAPVSTPRTQAVGCFIPSIELVERGADLR